MSRIILHIILVVSILGPRHLTNANNNIAYNIPDPGTVHASIVLPSATARLSRLHWHLPSVYGC